MDRRVDVERVSRVVEALNADVVALQEILHGEDSASQVRIIAERTGYSYAFGENRMHRGAPYGNATLSRLSIANQENYDITWRKRERRGCLRTDVKLGSGKVLHVFNVHLGTSFFERPHQARSMMSTVLARSEGLAGPRIVVGDFNEWTRGVATMLMHGEFESVDAKAMKRSYPGILPLFRLDHFYFDRHLKLTKFAIVRTPLAKIASDHLPLVADFEFQKTK
jgi:endonuclease/exonuclease/phosphatase family metal-dependent hydrolase